jgi:hypothetical protein
VTFDQHVLVLITTIDPNALCRVRCLYHCCTNVRCSMPTEFSQPSANAWMNAMLPHVHSTSQVSLCHVLYSTNTRAPPPPHTNTGGVMRALGTPHQLRARFGASFTLELRCGVADAEGAADISAAPPQAHQIEDGSVTASDADRYRAVDDGSGSKPAGSQGAAGGAQLFSQATRQEVVVAELSAQLSGLVVEEQGWGRVRAVLPQGPSCPPMAYILQVRASGCFTRCSLRVAGCAVPDHICVCCCCYRRGNSQPLVRAVDTCVFVRTVPIKHMSNTVLCVLS